MENSIRETLFNLSQKAYHNAYAPYSNYNVGAALITKDQKAFIGANIENASYGSSICAERVCICSAYANGVQKDDIVGFAIVSNSDEPAMPCGACLQVLNELLKSDTTIYVFNLNGECIETNMATLLPYPFDKDDLKNV
ncbi:cytidine deaminase [Bacilli bacterium PM5-3]|nr:cytidine deaminase [Bacilli bacterium PM5-3]MDH6602889.1 cytidine deaminase [Bacilli bacterium PM5-9]